MGLVRYMQSIEKAVSHTILVEKSKFICYLFPLTKLEDAKIFITKIQKKEKGATHVCYGYIFSSFEKCFDDGEPSGSAGLAILHVLQKKNIDRILCVVVRYFGGIKLGVGGLYRAYASSVKQALDCCTIVSLKEGYRVRILFSYEHLKQVDSLLSCVDITQKNFDMDVLYTFVISKEDYEQKKESLFYYVKDISILDTVFLKEK